MNTLAHLFIALIALQHLYIMWMEMFAWETIGKRTLKGAMPEQHFALTKSLAANQGLYNGFLAAGLTWSLLIDDLVWQHNLAVFFLSCVAIAGTYAGATATKKLFLIQALPALIAIILLYL